MSALQELDPAEIEQAVEEEDATLAESLGIDAAYEPVVMEPVSGYGPIIDAWLKMKYPLNVDDDGAHGVVQGQGVRHARQYPDGSGVYESTAGGQLYAIRTPGEVVVWNSPRRMNPWPYGTDPDDYDAQEFRVPYRFVAEVIRRQTDLDIHGEHSLWARGSNGNVVEPDHFMRGVVSADVLDDPDEDGLLLEHKDGLQVYVGYDSTAQERQNLFGFVAFDGTEGVRAPSAEDALGLLTPNEAVGADVRQGEWFLVESDGEPKGSIQKPGLASKEWRYTAPGIGKFETRHDAIGAATKEAGAYVIDAVRAEKEYTSGSPLDNHLPRDWKTAVDDETFVLRVAEELGEDADRDLFFDATPQDVIDAIYEGEIDLDYDRARELAGGVYVRGTIRHRENEHTMEKADDWMQATTHDWDVVTADEQSRSYAMD